MTSGNSENGIEIISRRIGSEAGGVTLFCCTDRNQKIFENQYALPDGMTYNSYLIEDRLTVVLDTTDHRVKDAWLAKLADTLKEHGRKPDYIIIQHLEPDHSSGISDFMKLYPECKILCSCKAACMLPHFCPEIAEERMEALNPGECLDTGSRKLLFIPAPMVHWPEVIMTYDPEEKILFCADAFGTFGTAEAKKGSDKSLAETWPDEARRYFINICGKYVKQVACVLKKASALEIKTLCPLHGPVIELSDFNPLPYYENWSSSEPESPKAVAIFAASLHGYSLEAAELLAEMLRREGAGDVKVYNLSETELSEAVSQAYRCGISVFVCATYDACIMPLMKDLISRLKSKGWHNRHYAVVENGSWAPLAGKLIKEELSSIAALEMIEPMVTVMTKVDKESEAALKTLAGNIAGNVKR